MLCLNEWYFQPTKCSNLRISRKRISPYRSDSINGIDVEVVSTEKDLGVVIVNDTSWKDHIFTIVAKANRLLGFIRRSCAEIVGSVPLLHLYYSLVRSPFCYCAQLWAPQSVISNLFLAENVQRRVTRFILKRNSSNSSYKDHLMKLKLLPFNYWLEYLALVFFFKCFHGHIDLICSLNDYFSFVTSQMRQACSGLNLKINNDRTSTFRDFYFNKIANLWNNIPNDVRQAESIDSLKCKLNSFYFKRLFDVFDRDNFRTFLICPKCR